MKKLFILITLITSIMILLVGCGSYCEIDKSNKLDSDYFVELKHYDIYESGINMTYKIVYAKDTKVKYLVARGCYRYAITPLYNTDGTLQIYEE